MRIRKSRVGIKVTALLVSLAALWVFAAWVTLRDGLNLLWVSRLDTSVAQPSEPLLVHLQKERQLSLAKLGDGNRQRREQLAAQRAETDAAIANFKSEASGIDVRWGASEALQRRLAESFTLLDTLPSIRESVNTGQIAPERVTDGYSRIIDSFFDVYESMATLDDEAFASDTRTLIELTLAREILSREDAILSNVLATGRFRGDQYGRFVQHVGTQRFLAEASFDKLRLIDPAVHQRLSESSAIMRVRALEDLVIRSNGAVPPITAEQWRSAVDPALAEWIEAVFDAGDALVERATPIALGVILRLVLAGGLGMLAVITSIVLSITTARTLVGQLERLRKAATELADHRLPSVVERLGRGERVDVATEAPPLNFGDDQIGQVGQAFNHVQQTAVRVAVEQAELRRSIREILLSLARRTQSLVHRQLTLLDAMERRESDPQDLKDLFRVDHLATRMRRNAENLIVLSGASPARSWRRPVPMIDVVRGALAEVEDYTRVVVPPMGEVSLAGRAVGDVIHLLAELIENAVSFSPPYTTAQVSGQMAANGYVIEIEDRGLGMSPADLEAANERIANPPEFDLRDTTRLGLYVVSRLAERHGIQVSLKTSPYGGTTAIVLIPRELVVEGTGEEQHERGSVATAAENAVVSVATAETPIPARRALTGEQPALVSRPEPVHAALSAPPTETEREPLAGSGGEDESQEDPKHVPKPSFTPHGLPFRVPQANLAPPLRTDPPLASPTEEETDDRSPEEIRQIMASYQMGTRRGRAQARQAFEDGGAAPGGPYHPPAADDTPVNGKHVRGDDRDPGE